MSNQLLRAEQQAAPRAEGLPPGTTFSWDAADDQRGDHVVLAKIAPELKAAGRYVCAQFTVLDDGSVKLGPMYPLPYAAHARVAGSLPPETVMEALEEQYNDNFGIIALRYLAGAGPAPWEVPASTEN